MTARANNWFLEAVVLFGEPERFIAVGSCGFAPSK